MTVWHEFRLQIGVEEVADVSSPDISKRKQQYYLRMFHNGITKEEHFDSPLTVFKAAGFILNNWNNGTRAIGKELEKDIKKKIKIVLPGGNA
jgi:hypothetical protein